MFSVTSYMGLFRMNDWWRSKAALLIGLVYLFVLWFNISFEKFLTLALLSIATISGFASFGYLLNDFFDREKDARAGKKNVLEGKSPILIALLFAVSLSFLLVPWGFLPFNRFSVSLIIFEILLFIIYSQPPLRLKEKGLAGIFADALYAHALPVVLACHTFSLASEQPLPILPVALLFVWQTISGVRNILLHQADDLDSDKKAGTKNYVAGIYTDPFHKTIRYLIISETAFSMIFLGSLAYTKPSVILLLPAILVSTAIFLIKYSQRGVGRAMPVDWRYFPNSLFEEWTPPILLVLLSWIDARFLFILPLHFMVFNINFFVQLFNRVIRPGWSATRSFLHLALISIRDAVYILLSFTVNRLIYYCFLLFGVDLKKENTSALGYMKKLRKTRVQ